MFDFAYDVIAQDSQLQVWVLNGLLTLTRMQFCKVRLEVFELYTAEVVNGKATGLAIDCLFGQHVSRIEWG